MQSPLTLEIIVRHFSPIDYIVLITLIIILIRVVAVAYARSDLVLTW